MHLFLNPSPLAGRVASEASRVGHAGGTLHPTRLLASLGATLPFQGRDEEDAIAKSRNGGIKKPD
jgi:hypothetical protein